VEEKKKTQEVAGEHWWPELSQLEEKRQVVV